MARTFRFPRLNLAVIALLVSVWSIGWSAYGPAFHLWRERAAMSVAQNSVLRLRIDDMTSCTAFTIRPSRILTAYHCVESGLSYVADGKPATLILKDAHFDLALLSVETQRPPLQFRQTDLWRGDRVTAIGYAGGLRFLHQAPGLFLQGPIDVTSTYEEFAPCAMFSFQGVPGMSGGPVVDSEGRLVSVISRGFPGAGCGMTPLLIEAFLYGSK